uniref:Ig-like domain-containing protein n=1 Tax=Equus asinus TaxID=9793 RepID=A0A8C4PSR0_EQUAS
HNPEMLRAWGGGAGTRLCFPGSLSLSGPRTVTGTVGGSLSVQCRYEQQFRKHNKYWCQNSHLPPWKTKIVETTESEKEVRSGRVSIRDHPKNLTFTVTLENLTEADIGTYWCGINKPWHQGNFLDPTFKVEVSVLPGELYAPSPLVPAPGPPEEAQVGIAEAPIRSETWSAHSRTRSLAPSLALLSPSMLPGLPGGALLLSMLGAVLWVNRPQRGSGGRQSQPAQGSPPCSPLSP